MRRSIYLSDSIRIYKKKVKQPLAFSPHILQELLIQKGALAGIAINWLRGNSR
jgi:hypothetical protein